MIIVRYGLCTHCPFPFYSHFESHFCSFCRILIPKLPFLYFVKLLEQALKTFPASTPERWDKIAEAVATRSKKECIKRCKVLIHFIRFCLLWMKIEFR